MNKLKGFTLIEILIALAVFAILATLTSQILYNSFTTKERLAEQTEKLTAIQMALLFIQRDTTQAVGRSVRSNNMKLLPLFVGESQYVELTRGGLVNPQSILKKSTLQRVAYLCQNNRLIRRHWTSLDTVSRELYQDKVLLTNLTSCKFNYLNATLHVFQEWRAGALQQSQRAEPFPKAIQFNLSLKKSEKMSFLFIIPEALYEES